jgi:hypothetical protein
MILFRSSILTWYWFDSSTVKLGLGISNIKERSRNLQMKIAINSKSEIQPLKLNYP